MTVEELIEHLNRMPPEMDIVLESCPETGEVRHIRDVVIFNRRFKGDWKYEHCVVLY